MEERVQQLQALKQAYRQEKRKKVTPWKWVTIVCLLLAVILVPLSAVLEVCGSALAVLSAKRGAEPVYYPSAYVSGKEYVQVGEQLFAQMAQESAVLIKNDGALPLSSGMKLTCAADDSYQAQGLCSALQQKSASGIEVAVVVCGGQELTDAQQTLLQESKEKGIKTVLVLLGTQAQKLLQQPADACLWMPYVQQETALQLLFGQANPSGRLPVSIGAEIPEAAGIYTDYRYYETRYEDFVTASGNAGEFHYSQQVTYPFGHGLSYTQFAYSQPEVTQDEFGFTLNITVTNTGSHAGREVVQVYAQAPYTQYDAENFVEKPAVMLVGFAKTATLAPGQSERVSVFVDKWQLGAYDAYGSHGYILEAGDYYLCAASDAHSAANQFLAAKGFAPATTENRMDTAADSTQVYRWSCPEPEKQDGDYNVYTIGQPRQDSISRQDWSVAVTKQSTPQVRLSIQPEQTEPVVTGAQNGIKLYQLTGLEWDDPYWEGILDQLQPYELVLLAEHSGLFVQPMQTDGILPEGQALAACFDVALADAYGKWAAEQWQDAGFVYESRLDAAVGDGFLLGSVLAGQAAGMQRAGVQVIAQPVYAQTFPGEQALRAEQTALRLLVEQGAGVDEPNQPVKLLAQQWDAKGMQLWDSPVDAEKLYTVQSAALAALRDQAKRTLYALVNSSMMNGIGPETETVAQAWQLQRVTRTAALLCILLVITGSILWIAGGRSLRVSKAYLDYKTLKKTIKEEKNAAP